MYVPIVLLLPDTRSLLIGTRNNFAPLRRLPRLLRHTYRTQKPSRLTPTLRLYYRGYERRADTRVPLPICPLFSTPPVMPYGYDNIRRSVILSYP